MEQRTLPLDEAARRRPQASARLRARVRPGACDRTVRALVVAIDRAIQRGHRAPMTITGFDVLAAGGPSPQHQHGPSISLQAAGKVWTATRQHHRGRVVWAVDEREGAELEPDLGPLVAEVGRVLGRDVTATEAIAEAVRLFQAT